MKVTPEMIEAGSKILRAYNSADDPISLVVAEIYEAMTSARVLCVEADPAHPGMWRCAD